MFFNCYFSKVTDATLSLHFMLKLVIDTTA